MTSDKGLSLTLVEVNISKDEKDMGLVGIGSPGEKHVNKRIDFIDVEVSYFLLGFEISSFLSFDSFLSSGLFGSIVSFSKGKPGQGKPQMTKRAFEGGCFGHRCCHHLASGNYGIRGHR